LLAGLSSQLKNPAFMKKAGLSEILEND